MLAAGIDVEVAVEGIAEAGLRKHAADGVLEDTLRVGGAHLGRGGLTLTAGITGVALINLVTLFLAAEDNLLGVDDDDIVAAVDVRGVAGLGLAAQNVGHAGSQATYGLSFGINQHTFLLDGLLVG